MAEHVHDFKEQSRREFTDPDSGQKITHIHLRCECGATDLEIQYGSPN